MLVLVSGRDVAHRLDSSMFCVEGCYEDGYVYDKDIFFMEGIEEFCAVGDRSSITDPSPLFEELRLFEQGLGPHFDYATNIAAANELLLKFKAFSDESLMFGYSDSFYIEQCCIPLCCTISANLKAYYACIKGMSNPKAQKQHMNKFLDVLYSQKGVKHQYFLDNYTN